MGYASVCTIETVLNVCVSFPGKSGYMMVKRVMLVYILVYTLALLSKIDVKLGKHITCRLVSDVRCGPRRPTRAGHDVAGMGLPGHLDSLGPDSEVLARVLASTSRLHAGSFEVARRTGSDAGLQPVTVENHLQAATGH